ncbi:mucin-17-like isoform X2 [Tachysurus ichikawai]
MKLNYFLSSLLVMLCIVGVFARNGRPITCCKQISKVIVQVTEILSYVHQNNALCSVKAVRFLLINGRTICSDPEHHWSKYAIRILDSRTTTPPSNTPSLKDTTTRISLPGITTESTVPITTPKDTSSTWKPKIYTHRFSAKQPLGKTSGQRTTTQITTMKTTTKLTTTMDSTPLITDIKTTDMTTTMTTESPVTMSTPKDTTFTYRASTKKLLRITRIPQHWTSTKQSTTITERATVTPDRKMTSMTTTTSKGTSTTWKPTAYITTKQETRVTMTTPKGKSTTKRQVQKTSTMNVTQGRLRCPPTVNHKLDNEKYNNKSIPWTIRRLKKKRKQGLRRVQMSPGCIEG